MTRRWDAVLIGSGIASLTCAALLAKKGLSVCVLEQHPKPGGYLHCFSRFGDRFDTGAHYVGAMDPGQPFHQLLKYAGVDPAPLFTPLDPSGFDVFHFPDFSFAMPKGYAELTQRLSALFPEEKAGIVSFFEKVRQTAAQSPTYAFHDEADPRDVLRAIETPLAAVVDSLVRDPRLKAILHAHCALHGVEPKDVGFGLHAILIDSLIRGPYGFSRGGDALAASFVEAIERAGGSVRVKHRVRTIENAGREARRIVCENGEAFEAEWFISGIHPKATLALFTDGGAFTPAFRSRLAAMEESPGLFGIYGAFREKAPDLSRRKNYFFFSTEDPERMFTTQGIDAAPNAVFACPAERADGVSKNAYTINLHSLAPHAWFSEWAGSKFGKRPPDYVTQKERHAQRVLELVDHHVPGFSNGLSDSVTSTTLSNLHFNGTPEGAAYGIYHSIANTGPRALGPRTHVANVLLTGQNCLFPGLLGAAISGLRTAGHVLGIKPLLAELRNS